MVLGAGLLAFIPAPPPAAAAVSEERPNILVIVTDDQRIGSMHVMPQTLQWFGDRGVEYSKAYATTPLCCPSRASIMTGLYAHNHGITTNGGAKTFPAERSVQAKLKASGYRTGFVGKYLNGWDTNDDPPYFHRWALMKNGRATRYNVDGRIVDSGRYQTDFLADKAQGFLERWDAEAESEPWYLYVAAPTPHLPYEPAAKYAEAKVGRWTDRPPREWDRSDKPPFVLDQDHAVKEGRRVRREQLRMLMSVDDLVAQLKNALRRLGENRNTLAMFLSDNGYTWGDHGILEQKRLPYAPSVQVPMYLRWPGVAPAGAVVGTPAANIDVAVTALNAAGLPTEGLDGRNLLSLGRERIFLEQPEETSGFRGFTVPQWASIRTTEWQYTAYFENGVIAFREYYDLVADPHELENIADEVDTTALDAEAVALQLCAGMTCP